MQTRSSFAALIVAGIAFALGASPALASLAVGTTAPTFHTKGAKAGKTFTVDLRRALRKGPVVLYFYPKAFTKGCTLEAHAFAEATDDFAKAGATVIGMSADDLPTLQRFSREECRDKFAVAVAGPKVIKAYDVGFTPPGGSSAMTTRTSYVIARNGRIVAVHSDPDYRDHVATTLEAVRKLAR